MKTHNICCVAENTKMLTISLDKRGWVVSDKYFSYSSMKTYVVGTQ